MSVLDRARFDRWLTREERISTAQKITLGALVHYEPVPPVHLCRDPKDDKFLSLALIINARYLITGDADLLVLDPFRETRILTPRAFLEA